MNTGQPVRTELIYIYQSLGHSNKTACLILRPVLVHKTITNVESGPQGKKKKLKKKKKKNK